MNIMAIVVERLDAALKGGKHLTYDELVKATDTCLPTVRSGLKLLGKKHKIFKSRASRDSSGARGPLRTTFGLTEAKAVEVNPPKADTKLAKSLKARTKIVKRARK